MRKVAALVRAAWLAATSYRLGIVLSFATMLLGVVPVYFVAHALQPTMASVIRGEGTQYFSFLIVGMMVLSVVTAAVYALPNAIAAGTSNGTLEALFTTPTPIPVLLAGLASYEVLFALARSFVLLVAAAALGTHVAWDRLVPAMPVLVLLIIAHIPFGLLAGAMILAFRTVGPLPQVIFALSAFLGGTYYPVHVIPGGIEKLSELLPMTYGLRAIRGVLLEGLSLRDVGRDVAILSLFTAGLMITGAVAFRAALRYARRAGTLAQY